jgi:hypothetical protein
MDLTPDEFIRRFVLHALPDGFHRIRHFGYLANGHRTEKARPLSLPPDEKGRADKAWKERTAAVRAGGRNQPRSSAPVANQPQTRRSVRVPAAKKARAMVGMNVSWDALTLTKTGLLPVSWTPRLGVS